MKVLIFEDEDPASKRLQKMLKHAEPGVEILDSIVSVASAVKWLKGGNIPDLIFSDIQLSDGLSFEIFRQAEPPCPVIFVTAFDQYAIEAFKVNSIDYLLKPIKQEELDAALAKFRKLKTAPALDVNALLQHLHPGGGGYKNRFVVRYGDHIKTINIEQVAYFYTEDRVNFLCTSEGRRYAIDNNLDSLETLLDPKKYFRINRQYIIGIQSIAEMFSYSKSRVLVKLTPAAKHETIVSTERSADFKLWLGDE